MKSICWVMSILLLVACKKDHDENPGPGGPNNPGQQLTITTISPDHSGGGVVITITGTGFNTTRANNEVRFGTLIATVKTASATQLTIELPVDILPGDYDVQVTANSKTTTKVKGFHFIGWIATTLAGIGDDGTVNGPAVDGPGNVASFRDPVGLAADAAGNLYVPDAHKIRKITPLGVVSTFAGSGARGKGDGNAASATFNFPTGVAVDGTGNVYVADQLNHLIRKISAAGVVSTIAGTGNSGNANGTGTAASFSSPYGVAVDPTGSFLYVGDYANHRIRKIDLSTNTVTTFAGNGSLTSTDGNGVNAGIPWPGGLHVDRNGNVYVTEKGAGRVRKITPAGAVTTIAGNLSTNTMPVHTAVDEEGNVYVVWKGLNKVKKITPAGQESDFIGVIDGGDRNGPAITAALASPEGIAITEDDQGRLSFYITDTNNKKIKKVTKE